MLPYNIMCVYMCVYVCMYIYVCVFVYMCVYMYVVFVFTNGNTSSMRAGSLFNSSLHPLCLEQCLKHNMHACKVAAVMPDSVRPHG